jgi:hypothetical protein
MKLFTPIEYIKIAVANTFGLDKLLWEERLDWFDGTRTKSKFEDLVLEAKEPMMFRKMYQLYSDAMCGIPTGSLIGLDATSSGIQILGALSACRKSCENSNLIDTGERRCAYVMGAKFMSNVTGRTITRDMMKDPLMTHFYASTEQPKLLFGEGTPELKAFYEMLAEEFTGADESMSDIASCWNPNALYHKWTLPDGHTAYVPVMEAVDKRIEVDELNHTTFTQRVYVNQPSEYGRSLPSNVTHSVDGYVVREMVRRGKKQGFVVLPIHDSFWCLPQYCNQMRQNYNNILAEICEMDLLSKILTEITGEVIEIIPHSDRKELANDIRNANYSLS